MSLVWINGRLVDKAEAGVSPFDHGFLYGDGVWEPLRVFGGKLFRPADHLHLLYRAAVGQGIEVPLPRDDLAAAIETTVRANNRAEGYVRVIVSRGPGTLGPDPRKIDPQVLIIAEEYYPFPPELVEHGLHAVTFAASPADARRLGRPEIVAAKCHAIASGCLEAILTDPGGRLVGSTEGMLFLVREGALVVAGGQIPDATGHAVAAEAGNAGLVVVEHSVPGEDLFGSDEAFIAGTSCGVIALVRVDDRSVGTGAEGPVTRDLRERFRVLTRGGG